MKEKKKTDGYITFNSDPVITFHFNAKRKPTKMKVWGKTWRIVPWKKSIKTTPNPSTV